MILYLQFLSGEGDAIWFPIIIKCVPFGPPLHEIFSEFLHGMMCNGEECTTLSIDEFFLLAVLTKEVLCGSTVSTNVLRLCWPQG